MQFKEKLMNQTTKWQKKPNFETDIGPKFPPLHPSPNFFSWVLPLLHVRHCRQLSSYSLSRKLKNMGTHLGLI